MKRNLLFGFLLSLSVVTSAETDLLDIEARVDSLVRRYCDSIAMAASLDIDKVDSIAKAYYDSLNANPIFDPNKITVLENGNVGIDTINPNYKLEVNGDIKGTKLIGLEAWSIQPQDNWPTSFNLSNNTGFWHMSAPRIWDVDGKVVPSYMGIYWASQQGADIAYKHVISFQESGNVGIGTESPTEKLDVMGKNQGTELWGYHRTKDFPSSVNLRNNDGFWHISGPRGYEGDNLAVFWVPDGYINDYSKYVRALTIEKSGKVIFQDNVRLTGSSSIGWGNWKEGTDRLLIGYNFGFKHGYIDFKDNLHFRADRNWISPLILQGDGNVAIGYNTTYSNDGSQYQTEGHKLAVKGDVLIKGGTKNYALGVEGTIAAIEIVLAPKDDWPDYVFSNEYNLPKLSEVEEFVNENNHLPDVPSAATVAEDGVSLGEMNKILLQKVEELTLYIIEQEKQMNKMQNQINSLME